MSIVGSDFRCEKLYLPSHIRRGRMSTCPTWRVVGWGATRDFQRKKDAVAYIDQQCIAERAAKESK